MIVEPDFLDHWKTLLLTRLLNDKAAPLVLLRLWAHCQQRKAWRFSGLSDEALAAICRWEGDAGRLRQALIEAQWLDEVEEGLEVHDWAEVNAKLASNWANGHRGGRPRITHAKPNDNPRVSDREDRLDREDRREKIENTPLPPRGRKKAAGKAQLPEAFKEPKRGRMLHLNQVFRRAETTAWNDKELRALEDSGLLELAELDFIDACEAVRSFYHASIPREIEGRFWRRTTLSTLLNNWGGELDKAREWARQRSDGVTKL